MDFNFLVNDDEIYVKFGYFYFPLDKTIIHEYSSTMSLYEDYKTETTRQADQNERPSFRCITSQLTEKLLDIKKASVLKGTYIFFRFLSDISSNQKGACGFKGFKNCHN